MVWGRQKLWTEAGFQVSGHADARYSDEQVLVVLAAWATFRGLTGPAQYQGVVHGHQVLIWGIHDRAEWDKTFAGCRDQLPARSQDQMLTRPTAGR